MVVYYNEFDEKAAAWLRELIARGLIADGIVDTRSIEDVRPSDLAGYTQCHFFAGIGVWSYALRQAGWPDDRAIWTMSCPCQPFSAAGKGGGFDDERHLWPAAHWLIQQRRPAVVFGEQVASKDGLGWLDLVQADLEGTGYASGAVDLCAAGVGAPHIRQRLWWFGERLGDDDEGLEGQRRRLEASGGWDAPGRSIASASGARRLADNKGFSGRAGLRDIGATRNGFSLYSDSGAVRGLAYSDGGDASAERQQRGGEQRQQPENSGVGLRNYRPGPTNGLWGDADWLFCRDGKWRPVEPGTFPLVNGAAERVGRLRGYGNAIVAPAAQAFIEAYLEAKG